MPEKNRATGTEAAQDTTLDAAINTPVSLVTIFASDGTAMSVPPETAELLIRSHGFRRENIDLKTVASDFRALFAGAQQAIEGFLTTLENDGVIDPSEQAAQATAYAAMELVTSAWGALLAEIARQYPMKQGDAYTLQEQRARITVNGTVQELSLLELTARRMLEPNNDLFAEQNVQYVVRDVQVDPAQAAIYLATPGFSEA
ncbi:hypothetical protein SE17_01705 [Kouleothrix aurantiaca]|uniref:Uncharacterized protein n=1 Tax=Kouleothrix aurantiaca TaxID=186479 RepID=A0A0P9DXX3_9CHLR|nr:hypothetical protein SE17_01705 [Kouleothrix aurantiaca]